MRNQNQVTVTTTLRNGGTKGAVNMNNRNFEKELQKVIACLEALKSK